ncbi:MAG: hypothetical protein ACKVP3_01950 [Hyphomicrobiaceae bacterium]
MASALAALRLLGKVALLAAGILTLMIALVDLPDMAVPEAIPSKAAKPIEHSTQSETAQCLEYQGL